MKGLTFSAPMMIAWLEGRKSVTRRLVNPQPDYSILKKPSIELEARRLVCLGPGHHFDPASELWGIFSKGDKGTLPIWGIKPRYQPGETVYIKETWAIHECGRRVSLKPEAWPKGWPIKRLRYNADAPLQPWTERSSMFMPEWASRSHARIKSVRVERIQEITEKEAGREGFCPPPIPMAMGYDGPYETADLSHPCYKAPSDLFAETWESLHPGSWDRNDWVWVYELEKL